MIEHNFWGKWNKWIIAGIAASVSGVIGFNLLVDPYDVFGGNLLRPYYSFNERYNKIQFLVETEKGRYDSYLVGSSVMGAFDPDVANRLRPGQSYYNLSYLGGMPSEAFASLRVLHDQGHPIKEIVMGIDVFPFHRIENDGGFDKRPHPMVSGESSLAFHTDYLFASSLFHGLSKILNDGTEDPAVVFDVRNGGMYRLTAYDRDIQKDHAGFTAKHVRRDDASKSGAAGIVWIESRFQNFREFNDWLKANNIKATFFIHPFNHFVRDFISTEEMQEFKSRIAEIVGKPVTDLSMRKDITDNDLLYYDLKHYRPVVANQILTELLTSK
jgi:hypothetical protein